MIAWKLLQPGAIGLFSGFAWPTPTRTGDGTWVEVAAPLRPSIHGIHAVRPDSLLEWLDDELWEIELDGEIIEAHGLLVASRARLRRRVPEWDGPAAAALTQSCVEAVRDAVAAELERSGATDATAMLAGLADDDSIQSFVSRLSPGEDVRISGLIYLVDCVKLAAGGRPEGFDDHPGRDLPTTPAAIAANVGFVAAAGVGMIAARAEGSAETFEQAFGRERARQNAWLAERLQLEERV